FRSIEAIVVFKDGAGDAFVSDGAMGSLLAVAIDSGNRKVVDRVRVGGPAPLGRLGALGVDPASGHVFAAVNSSPHSGLIEIAPRRGEHSEIPSDARGGGPPLAFVEAVAVAPSRGAVLMLGLDVVASVDLATGDRTIVADDHTGSGSSIHFATALA